MAKQNFNPYYEQQRYRKQIHCQVHTYENWCKTDKKGDINYYQPFNQPFLTEYSENQMDKNRNLIRCLIRDKLRSFIASSSRTSYRMLSLGCGPGSDLLAVLDVFLTSRNADNREIELVDLTGVDELHWPRKEFKARLSEFEARGPPFAHPWRMYSHLSMQNFARHAESKGLLFDLIIMSFAEVKTKVSFVCEQLPELLQSGGSIFIVDNDIPPVWQLAEPEFGFELVDRRTNSVFLAK